MPTVSKKGLFTLTYLIIVIYLPSMIGVKQTFVLFRIVQSVFTKPLLETRLQCAFGAMHHTYAAVRIAEGSGKCEKLTDAEMTTLGLEGGFEYLQKKSIVEQFKPDLFVYLEPQGKVLLYPYSEVKVGDVFEFVLKKSGSEKFVIRFESRDDYVILSAGARIDVLILNSMTTEWAKGIAPPYPFSAFKEYRITFKIVDSYWQMSVDGSVCCQFEHRQSVSTIEGVAVYTTGLNITVSSATFTTAIP